VVCKSPKRRTFEAGVRTDDSERSEALMEERDQLYRGKHCVDCGRREYWPDPIVEPFPKGNHGDRADSETRLTCSA